MNVAGRGKNEVVARFMRFDVVRLRHGVSEFGIPPGTEAEVLDVYPAGYEVEVIDDNGRMLYVGPAADSDLELVARS